MKTFVHRPTEVEAIQVGKPYLNITKAFPFSRQIKAQSGKLKYFLLSRPGQIGGDMAYPGDWIVKDGDTVGVLSDEEFQARFQLKEDVDWLTVPGVTAEDVAEFQEHVSE